MVGAFFLQILYLFRQSLVVFEKVAQIGLLSDIANSDECGIITNEDQEGPGAPPDNDNAAKDHIKESIGKICGVDFDQLKKDYIDDSPSPLLAELKVKRRKASAKRVKKYSSNWQKADMEKTIKKLIPNPTVHTPNLKGKVVISSSTSKVCVVCDLFGGYFRIQDIETGKYLGLNGEEVNNITENGKTRGRNKKEFNAVTHFKMR